jgi:site-specific DNA-cytosine methylase
MAAATAIETHTSPISHTQSTTTTNQSTTTMPTFVLTVEPTHTTHNEPSYRVTSGFTDTTPPHHEHSRYITSAIAALIQSYLDTYGPDATASMLANIIHTIKTPDDPQYM